MSKRFTIWGHNEAQIEDNVELESYICLNEREAEEVCELLNELDEKNNELKEFIRNLTNFKGEILLSNGRAYKREYVERLLE
jgi:hypothetical protein